jgi:hypothetical protein
MANRKAIRRLTVLSMATLAAGGLGSVAFAATSGSSSSGSETGNVTGGTQYITAATTQSEPSLVSQLDTCLPPGKARPTVVLVHGAWADARSWSGEVSTLQAAGYDVRAIANPWRTRLPTRNMLLITSRQFRARCSSRPFLRRCRDHERRGRVVQCEGTDLRRRCRTCAR